MDKALNNDDEASWSDVPLLDRTSWWELLSSSQDPHYPGSSSSSSKNHPVVVRRHVGMVQDMLEPEYYYCHDNHDDAPAEEGKSSSSFREGQPLVVVPIPYWKGRQGVAAAASPPRRPTAATLIPESPPSITQADEGPFSSSRPRKRDRDDDASASTTTTAVRVKREGVAERMEMEETSPTSTSSSSPPSTGMMIYGPDQDWWPAGCLESDPTQLAILATVQYKDDENEDHYHHHHPNESHQQPQQQRLQLNDIVECIGIVGRSSLDDPQYYLNDEELSGWGNSGGVAVPPPSRLPRLQVLYYRKLDGNLQADYLYGGVAKNYTTTTTTNDDDEHDSTHDRMDDEDHDMNTTTTMTSHRDGLQICKTLLLSPLVAEALYVTLLSQAERDWTTGNMQRAPPHATLGCLPLELQCHDDHSSSGVLYESLQRLLREICPVVACMDFTTSKNPNAIFSFPSKETGRLVPNPWQLPKGATLLIHMPQRNNATARRMVEDLTSQHSIPYTFEGGMKIPFDADVRIIVVTTTTGDHTKNSMALPGTLSLTVSQDCVEQLSRTMAATEEEEKEATRMTMTALATCLANRTIPHGKYSIATSRFGTSPDGLYGSTGAWDAVMTAPTRGLKSRRRRLSSMVDLDPTLCSGPRKDGCHHARLGVCLGIGGRDSGLE